MGNVERRNENRDDWGVVAGISLIVLGVWFLAGNFLGDAWHRVMQVFAEIAWPVGLIILGAALYVYSTRGERPSSKTGRRLYRSRESRMIGGVLGGVAEYLGVDPTLIRVLYVVVAYMSGVWPAILAYVIALIVVPTVPVVWTVDASAATVTSSPPASPSDSASRGDDANG